MRIIVVGPGRAGVSVALAARDVGHEVVAVVGRTRDRVEPVAEELHAAAVATGEPLPSADLLLVATDDSAIASVAARLAALPPDVAGAAHLSGLVPVAALDPLARLGIPTGAFHPLQTFPTAETGARRLPGAWVAITAGPPLHDRLAGLATSLGCHPFPVDDDVKPLYHAAAAAAANFTLGDLALASDLFESAGVPFTAARPLVEAIVANAFELGPRDALTGPVARGDVQTVEAQLRAVAAARPDWLPAFTASVRQLAVIAGRSAEFAVTMGPSPGSGEA